MIKRWVGRRAREWARVLKERRMVGISWAGNPVGKVGESGKIGHCQFHVWGKKGSTS